MKQVSRNRSLPAAARADGGRGVARRWAAPAVLVALALAVSPAFAGDAKTEAEAKKLQQDAMDVDFLALDLAAAQKKLESAIKKCGTSKCNTALVAGLHRDLGVVLINQSDGAGGEREFSLAVTTDSTVTMPKDFLDNVEVRKTWESVKKKLGSSGSTTTTTTTTTATTKPTSTPPSSDASGGLIVKIKVAPTNYELPIVVEVPDGVDAVAVKVSYRTESMEKFKVVDATKSGGKWLALLPCAVTGSPGTIKFFARAFDSTDVEIDHYANIKKPAEIELKKKLDDTDEVPTLPGDKEPKSCGGGEAAPVDKRPEGSGCATDEECQEGLACLEGDNGKLHCAVGEHKPKASTFKRFWIGIDGDMSINFLGQDSNLCQQQTWACSANGSDVGPANTLPIYVDPKDGPQGGTTQGGAALGPIHALVTADYFLSPRIAIGAKVGWGFGGNPTNSQPFLGFHGEARFHYFFMEGVFRPFVTAGAGFSELDSGVPNVIVTPDAKDAKGVFHNTPDAPLTNVTAYKLLGPAFGAIGGGAWIMAGSNFAINVGVKAIIAFPTFGFGISPELGIRIGF